MNISVVNLAWRLWKLQYRKARMPLFWMFLRPTLTLAPSVAITLNFVTEGRGFLLVACITFATIASQFFRNSIRLNGYLQLAGQDAENVGYVRVRVALGIRFAIEYGVPLYILGVILSLPDFLEIMSFSAIFALSIFILVLHLLWLSDLNFLLIDKFSDYKFAARYLGPILIVCFVFASAIPESNQFALLLGSLPLASSIAPFVWRYSLSDISSHALMLGISLSISLITYFLTPSESLKREVEDEEL